MSTAATTREVSDHGLGLRAVAQISEEARVDLPGLPARLASLAAELRLIAGNYPVSGLASVGLGDAIEQAQSIREMAHALTAVLAGEVERRRIPADQGLSRNDWVTAHSPNLEGGQSAAVTAVGAALTEDRWRDLARKVRAGAATVDKAAVIVRFHNEMHRVADPQQLHELVESFVEHVEAFSVKELRRLVTQARAALRPPADVEDDEARMRAGRAFTKVRRSAGMTEYRLRLDPEGAAIVDAAIDPLARPRPDLDWDAYRQPAERVEPTDSRATNEPGATETPGATDQPGGGTGSRPCPHVQDRDCVGPCTCEPSCECRADCSPAETRRDPRTAPTRRADALLELIGRAVAAPEGVTRTPRTKLVITMTLEALLADLRDAADNGGPGPDAADGSNSAPTGGSGPGGSGPVGTGARSGTFGASGFGTFGAGGFGAGPGTDWFGSDQTGADGARGGAMSTPTGVADNDEVLSAGAIRRLACEATIIPAVLGGPSSVLDLGYTERYFTPAQRRALTIRDKHCTYPGCTIPPQWCECHHVRHWCHGGPTTLDNGALLCGRHHTIVHQLDLTATVTAYGVTWHRPTHPR